MPSGDNWQGDVLRDLRAGAAGQRAAQQGARPGEQSGAQPEQAPPQQEQQQPQQAAGQPGPQVPPQGPNPAYGYPQQQHQQPGPDPAYGYPQQQPASNVPQQQAPYGYPQQQAPYGYPQQGYADQAQQYAEQAQAYAAQHQPQPYADQGNAAHPQQQAAPTPQPAPARRAPASRTTPDSRPAVDKRIADAGLKPRRGEPFGTRALRAVRRTVSSSAAREVAETTATAEVLQQAVTTGRQIAVTSIRGGSGKTTVAALLSTTYAHYRQDPVLAVEADPALGTLPLRLGAENLRWTTGDLADVVEPQMSLLDITGYLVQLPDNAWLLPGSQGQVGAMLDTRSYERVMVSLRRYFGVTVVDCETLPAEVARTALSAAQARVLTVPATLEGVASTHAVLQWMRGLPRDITTSTVVVLTETVPHTGVDLDKAAEPLKATGASVRVLPYDRHLAAGGTIRTDLLARATRQAAAGLAAEVFQLSQKRR
ncbi:MinD/ParA family ATP-binding protein [Streptomyces spinoverrucosus]|uniref:MinD/ParA family ATP-binding protein n=1 Tax=Streptomyces spinoverrucosus TaxID=284043 RepID=UPI001E3FD248|nr:MinD/ParA family protein [Streptomyces spinoverrucosus]